MDKPIQLTLTYTRQLMRAAVFHFWLKSVGVVHLIVAFLILPIWLGMFYRGDSSWLMGFFAALFLVYILFIIAIYVVHYRQSWAKFKAMDTPQAEFTADDTGFTISSSAGSSTLPWSSIKDVWQFNDFWLLLFSKAQFMTFPLAEVNPETQQFILEKIKQAQVKQ